MFEKVENAHPVDMAFRLAVIAVVVPLLVVDLAVAAVLAVAVLVDCRGEIVQKFDLLVGESCVVVKEVVCVDLCRQIAVPLLVAHFLVSDWKKAATVGEVGGQPLIECDVQETLVLLWDV